MDHALVSVAKTLTWYHPRLPSDLNCVESSLRQSFQNRNTGCFGNGRSIGAPSILLASRQMLCSNMCGSAQGVVFVVIAALPAALLLRILRRADKLKACKLKPFN